MGRNNNNVGMHMKKFSQYGACDDLAYYDKKANEAVDLFNKKNQILAEMEKSGDFEFTKFKSFVNIFSNENEFVDRVVYRMNVYTSEHTNDLKHLFNKYLLKEHKSEQTQEIEVFVFEDMRKIYVDGSIYNGNPDFFRKDVVYDLLKK